VNNVRREVSRLPFVSVVVIVYNMRETIPHCLKSLRELDYPKEKYEIIVVDGGSDDGTQDIVKDFDTNLFVEKRSGRGLARNVGIKLAKGDIVAFIDADCVAARDWLLVHIKNHFDKSVGAVGGSVINPDVSFRKVFTSVYHYENFAEFDDRAPKRFMYHIPTCNASFKKSVLEKVGLFEETANHYEDFILSQKLLKNGYKLLFDPSAKTYHLEKELSAIDYIKNEIQKGKWHYRAQSLCKNMFGRLPTNRVLASFLLPSIIFVRGAREVYKLRYALRVSNLAFIPLFMIGASVWGVSYLTEVFSSD
jgi:glycosyltransferase involved in cell wall biosynthesis